MKVAILGGTGSFGLALARRLEPHEAQVVIGSRDADRARAVAEGVGATGAANEAAVEGVDLVVLAVNAEAALATAHELAPAIGSTPVLCVASVLRFGPGGVYPGTDGLSIAEQVDSAVSGAVCAGLHSLAAHTLGGEAPPEEDALVCGDDRPAKELALELASRVVSGRAVDAGPLASARALEGMTAVIVNVNRRYKAHAGLRLTGLP